MKQIHLLHLFLGAIFLIIMPSWLSGQTYLINESFEESVPPPGWTNSGTYKVNSNPRTGSASLGFNGYNDAIYTPSVSLPQTLGFWYKRSTNTSHWELIVEVSADAATWVTLQGISNATTDYQQFTADISSYSNVFIRLRDARQGSGAEVRYVDDFTITQRPADPEMIVNPLVLDGFTYSGTGPSQEQSFTLTGLALQSVVTILPPSAFEVSLLSGAGFTAANPLELNPVAGMLQPTEIFVRMKQGLPAGAAQGSIICTSSAAEPAYVQCFGMVTIPEIPGAPVALPATGISQSGFTANWLPVQSASGYLLNVYTQNIQTPPSLVISEYAEGTSYRKAIEIYNGTGMDVDLSAYSIKKQSNGAGSFSSELALSGLLTTGDTYVVAYTSAASGDYITGDFVDLYSGSSAMSFNGNDAIALCLNGIPVDIVGIPDQPDPYWGADVTLVRKPEVIMPNTDWDPGNWISFETNYTGNLGVHTASYTNQVAEYNDLPVGNAVSYPVTGLQAATGYYYTVKATSADGNSDPSNRIEVTTLLPVYVSAQHGDWAAPATWQGGEVPGPVNSVRIAHDVTVYTQAGCDHLEVTPEGSLTVVPQGSLIAYGTGEGSVSVIRDFSGGWNSWNTGWHMIGAPVAGQNFMDFATSGAGNDYDLYGWDELHGLWMNAKDEGFAGWNGSENFETGRGYLISYEQNEVQKIFTGTLVTGDLRVEGLGVAQGGGWHLLGNPYPSPIVWNDGNWQPGAISGIAKLWNSAAASYTDLLPGMTIPQGFGFMVQSAGNGASLTIPAASRTHNTSQWIYSETGNAVKLAVSETDGGTSQVVWLRSDPDAGAGYDFIYDARFVQGYAPLFYSLAGNERLSVNTVPSFGSGTAFNLGFVKNAATGYTLELLHAPEGYTVFMTDHLLQKTINLSSSETYRFESAEADDPGRFTIFFGTVGLDPDPESPIPSVSVSGNIIHISSAEHFSWLELHSTDGRLITRLKIGKGSIHIPYGNFPAGMYILSISDSKRVLRYKLILN